MSEINLFVTAREGERAFSLSRHAILRHALRGDVRFQLTARGRVIFSAADLQRVAGERSLRRAAQPRVRRQRKRADEGAA